jgi:hypothetical protein
MISKVVFIAGFTLLSSSLFGEVVYSSMPTGTIYNVPSLGYQATQTAEFGNAINLAGTDRSLSTISVLMSDWALQPSTGPNVGTDAGFVLPLTMTLYNTTTGTDAVGASFAQQTIDATIPWRPEADPTCPGGGTAWRAGDGNCYNGLASVVTFDFSGAGVTLPDTLIFGLSYNTETWGAHPTGVDGPYDSLNFGLGGGPVPSTGSNIYANSAYWNTSTASDYTDLGAGGVGTFRRDTNWNPFEANVEITATPEPGTFVLLGSAVLLLAAGHRRKLINL